MDYSRQDVTRRWRLSVWFRNTASIAASSSSPLWAANSAGEQTGGADNDAAAPSTGERSDAKLTGPIEVSVDIQDEATASKIRDAFAEFGAHDVGRG